MAGILLALTIVLAAGTVAAVGAMLRIGHFKLRDLLVVMSIAGLLMGVAAVIYHALD
jgi:hypothetical protein